MFDPLLPADAVFGGEADIELLDVLVGPCGNLSEGIDAEFVKFGLEGVADTAKEGEIVVALWALVIDDAELFVYRGMAFAETRR